VTVDRLVANQQLNINGELLSNNGLVNLIMQGDGNLVLYRTLFRRPLWASNTFNQPVTHAIMQGDGNFVAYTAAGVPMWSTNTWNHPGAWVVLQDDGNLVMYDSNNHALWASSTVQDFNSPIIEYSNSGYTFDETSESWKQLCSALPCFAAIQWPDYDTKWFDAVINEQPVVIQLWKGYCPRFLGGLGHFPGGVGAEVGVYHRIPGKIAPTSLPPGLPPNWVAAYMAAISTANLDLWWPFPELKTTVEFTLTNPVTNQTFFSAGPEGPTYWLTKWMEDASYSKYQVDQGRRWWWLPPWWPGNSLTPPWATGYLLDYKINSVAFPRW
jgi:hypothetical protein